MQHNIPKLLADIIASGEIIVSRSNGKSAEDYRASVDLRSILERHYIIIGEALNRLDRTHPDVASKINARTRSIAFRNYLVHGYDTVDHDIVWQITREPLPNLRETCRSLLKAYPIS